MDSNAAVRPEGQQPLGDEEPMPAWARFLMQQVQEQAAESQKRLSQQEEVIVRLEQRLAAQLLTRSEASLGVATPQTSQQRINVGNIEGRYQERIPAQDDEEPLVQRKKDELPDAPEFDGKKQDFQPWLAHVHAKLTIDREDRTEAVRAWYVHSRLRGKAMKQVNPWVAQAQSSGTMTVEGLVEQLRLAYEDPMATARAATRLNSLKQGTKSFAVFIADFDRTILEAGGAAWADSMKQMFLSNSMSEELKRAMVTAQAEPSYARYCSQLHTVSQRLEALQDQKKTQTSRSWNQSRSTPKEEGMDWEPTRTVAIGSTQGTKWASDEETARRRKEGLCLKCGNAEHFVRNCKSHQKKGKSVRVAKVAATLQESDESADEASDDSGKE
jgi:hypothetical protein